MKNLELENFGLVEMNSDEMLLVDGGGLLGGLLGALVGAVVGLFIEASGERDRFDSNVGGSMVAVCAVLGFGMGYDLLPF